MKWIVVGLIILIISGMGVKEYQKSQVVGHSQYRFNLALIVPDSGVTFVSIDPVEKSVLALPLPTELAIKSRGSGEYAISSLYKLGNYQGKGGQFVRQKIQGFMRVPVPGYLTIQKNSKKPKSQMVKALLGVMLSPKKQDTSLSRIDAALLLARITKYRYREIGEEELVRSGVIVNKIYHPERLQEYVGNRLFDWGIGAEGVTVAIVNASGENGLGSDMADFLSNLGMDVVIVRSGEQGMISEHNEWQVGEVEESRELNYIFQNLFGFGEAKIEAVPPEYRAKVLIRVGKEAKDLF